MSRLPDKGRSPKQDREKYQVVLPPRAQGHDGNPQRQAACSGDTVAVFYAVSYCCDAIGGFVCPRGPRLPCQDLALHARAAWANPTMLTSRPYTSDTTTTFPDVYLCIWNTNDMAFPLEIRKTGPHDPCTGNAQYRPTRLVHSKHPKRTSTFVLIFYLEGGHVDTVSTTLPTLTRPRIKEQVMHGSSRRCVYAGAGHLLCGQSTNATSHSRSIGIYRGHLFFDVCLPARASGRLTIEDGPTTPTLTPCTQKCRLFRQPGSLQVRDSMMCIL